MSNQDTWLIQDAPGAGESALLSHLQDTWKTRADGPVTVRIPTNNLRNKNNVTRMIANRIMPWKILNKVRFVEAGAGVDFSIRADGRVTDGEQMTGLVLDDLAQLYGKGAAAVSKRLLKGKSLKRPKLRPIVVMIDEVQFFEAEDVPILRKLHTGENGLLPILALLCGLAYSESMLVAAGISRFAKTDEMSHVQIIAPLEVGEAAESVRAMFNGYQIKGWHNSDLPDKIDAWCYGWPQFLEHYMISFTEPLSANDLDLAGIDELAVRSAGDASRAEYYRDR